ncbi:MAG: SCO1664 family protein [Chloroflexi bacterium]|nr:SCO1664 family protein [Chloroflexota bacterium]
MNWDPFRSDIESLLQRAIVVRSDALPWGSNYTFLLTLADGMNGEGQAVYKPRRGEAPLWDFPAGTLYLRECAAYVVGKALGWPDIPPTVIRDGPHGPGSVQLYIDADPDHHYFAFRHRRQTELQCIALFDALANNADRKAGHCLEGRDGRVWCIDHGLTFHVDPKLRTVIWDFCGEPIPRELLADLRALRSRLSQRGSVAKALGKLLSSDELDALRRRLDWLLEKGAFPYPGPGRHIPWPPV